MYDRCLNIIDKIIHVLVISITHDTVISCTSITITQILLHVHWYMDTLMYYTQSLLHGYSTPSFHVLVSLLHEHYYFMYWYHWLHWHCTCTFGTCITVARVLYTVITCICRMDSPMYMLWLFLHFFCNGLLFLLRDYSCISATWLYLVILICYSCYWTYELLKCDVWN